MISELHFTCFLSEFQKDDSQRLLESFNCDEKEHTLTKSKAEPYISEEEMVLEVKLCYFWWMSIFFECSNRHIKGLVQTVLIAVVCN